MSGNYCWNDEARLGWFEGAGYGDTCVAGEGHGMGKFHGTVAYRSFHRLVLEELQASLLPGTTHKSESYSLPNEWDLANSIESGLSKNNAIRPKQHFPF